jgi:hypothetical protein
MREIFIQRFDEEIREIVGFLGYWASNLGRIVSEPKSTQTKWVVLRPRGNHNGHYRVNVHQDGKYYTKFVHELVCKAFHDCDPSKGSQVRHHPDPNPANNRADNLKWGFSIEDGWDWIVDNGRQENWGISPTGSKKNSWKLQMHLIPGEGQKSIGYFPTIESARAERDKLCLLHGMAYRLPSIELIAEDFLDLAA